MLPTLRVLVAMIVLGVLAACGRDALAPLWPDAAEHQQAIELTSMRVGPDGGGEGLRLAAKVTFVGGPDGTVEDLVVSTLEMPERQRLAAIARRVSQPTVAAGDTPQNDEVGARLASVQGPRVTSRTVTRRDGEGTELKLVAIQFEDRNTGALGPLGPSFLYRNGSLEAIVTPMGGSGAAHRGLRIVSYGKDGTARSVSELRTSDVMRGSLPALLGELGAAVQASCRKGLSFLSAQPLHAQEEECVDAEVDMMFAGSAFVAAEAAAVIACPSTGPACAVALTALSAAAAYLAWTTTQYQNCIYDYQEEGHEYQGQVGGGSSGPGPECETWDIEISYDGGNTWHYLDSFVVCSE